jgi:large subunit ribosomal protein L4
VRNEVRGGGRKPYRQKKTGRARAGTIRSPLWIGGGSIFGPQPREYTVKLTSKMKKLARKSALSYKAKEKAIIVVEDFSMDAPKTKEISGILKGLDLSKKKTLMLTSKTDLHVFKSSRNITTLAVQSADNASTYDILAHQVLLIQKSAVDVLQKPLQA